MIELHLIGYTSDLRYLVLDLDPESDRGRYRLVVDGDLLLTLDELRDLRAQAGMDVGVPYERLEERLGVTIARDRQERGEDRVEERGEDRSEERGEDRVEDDGVGRAEDRDPAPEPAPPPPDEPAGGGAPPEPPTARPPTSLPPPRPRTADAPAPAFRLVEAPPPVEEEPVAVDPDEDGRRGAPVGPEVPAEPRRSGEQEEPDELEEPEAPEPPEGPEAGEPPAPATPPPGDERAGPERDSALSPAQIQARLRAGRRPESVAEEAGTDVAWVERWLPPILTERAQVLQEARALHLVRPRKGRSHAPLGEAVAANLRRRHLDPDEDADWSVKRRASGRWSINVRYRYRGKARSATWALDREEGELTPSSEAARVLGWTDGA